MKRRKLPADKVKYPMILGLEMYERLQKLGKAQDTSVAVLIDSAIADLLLGSNKDRYIKHMEKYIETLKGQIKSGDNGEALSNAMERILELEELLGAATGKLSEIEGYLNQ